MLADSDTVPLHCPQVTPDERCILDVHPQYPNIAFAAGMSGERQTATAAPPMPPGCVRWRSLVTGSLTVWTVRHSIQPGARTAAI